MVQESLPNVIRAPNIERHIVLQEYVYARFVPEILGCITALE
jgi:hypothetical protein